jgi:hypothetical protein
MTTFYSRQTGNWEDGANWSLTQGGSALNSPGVAGTDYPGSGDKAYILHHITVTTDMSGLATSVTVTNHSSGGSNGWLDFKPDATTGLRILYAPEAFTAFRISAGTRTAPIQRGYTCTLVSDAGNFPNASSGSLTFETWGMHREMVSNHVYADKVTVAISRHAKTITVNKDMNPVLSAGDQFVIIQNTTNNNPVYQGVKHELLTVESYNSSTGVITLKNRTRCSYDNTNTYIFRAGKYLNSTELATSNNASSADFQVADNLYPTTTPAGKLIVTKIDDYNCSKAYSDTISSYNASTKTFTCASTAAYNYIAGGIVIADDFNVFIKQGDSYQLGSSSGVTSMILAYTKIQNSKGIGYIFAKYYYNSAFINCRSIGDPGSGNNFVFQGYGISMASTPGYTGTTSYPFSASESICLIRGRFSGASNGGSLPGFSWSSSLRDSWFQDCVFHTYSGKIFATANRCYFKDCGLYYHGNDGISQPNNTFFDNCYFAGENGNSNSASLYVVNGITTPMLNYFGKITFGKTRQGANLANVHACFHFDGYGPRIIRIGSLTIGPSTPLMLYDGGYTNSYGAYPIVKGGNWGGDENSFRNFFYKNNYATNDASVERTSGKGSIKFAFFNDTDYYAVFHDIPVYLTAGSRTFTIYTNPSSGITWDEPPLMMLFNQSAQDFFCMVSGDMPYLAYVEQTTLTASTWSQLNLTYTIPADGVYIIRLYAKTGTNNATLNWADFSFA